MTSCSCNESITYCVTVTEHVHVFSSGRLSHTRTVVRECCKGDEASQWRKPKFDPPPRPNPVSDRNRHTWLRRGPLRLCKSSSRSDQGFRFRACVTSRTKSAYSASFFPFFRDAHLRTPVMWPKLTAANMKIVKSPYLSEQELSYRQQIARQLRTQCAEGI